VSFLDRLARGFLTPNLLGLARPEVRALTWRSGVATCAGLWLMLVLGLVIVFVDDWTAASSDTVVTAWLAWGGGMLVLAAASGAYALLLLRDGWRHRGAMWRLVVGAGIVIFLAIWVRIGIAIGALVALASSRP
jgi:hypothetical protein